MLHGISVLLTETTTPTSAITMPPPGNKTSSLEDVKKLSPCIDALTGSEPELAILLLLGVISIQLFIFFMLLVSLSSKDYKEATISEEQVALSFVKNFFFKRV